MKLSATGDLVGRAVQEWIGANADSVPPPIVRERIFLRAKGVCHISKRKIRAGEKWQAEHVIPIWKGGKNRESNLAPAMIDKHKIKTSSEAAERSAERKMRQKNLGIKRAKGKIQSQGFRPAKSNTKFIDRGPW